MFSKVFFLRTLLIRHMPIFLPFDNFCGQSLNILQQSSDKMDIFVAAS